MATVDGDTHEVDVLILATGFQGWRDVLTYPVRGPDGRSLSRFWDDHRRQAYEGVSIPGFPNFFTVFGPYGFVGSSYFALIESQTRHIVRCLKQARRRHASRIEVSQEANDRYFAEMMRKRHRQIFWQDSCTAGQQLLLRRERRCAPAAGQHGRGVLAQPPLPARRLPLHRVATSPRPSAMCPSKPSDSAIAR